MQTIEAHRNARRTEFIRLIKTRDETGCLLYIAKYDDFYDAVVDDDEEENMLQLACIYRLDRVAIALINKKCDLIYQDKFDITALMTASHYGLKNIVAHIIDNLTDITTRKTCYGKSEIMYLCGTKDEGNIIKMIDRGYDIYYKNDKYGSLFTEAIGYKLSKVIKKMIDIDTDFANQFNTQYSRSKYKIRSYFYNTIVKYINDKHDTYKHEIITTMNEASPTNALYQSFRNTYAVGLVDVICDFILLRK
ncbi:MAG: hypothetical protein Faunusvirus64_1 [Faunusvirus sp.]|jgi:hypothetical protein|uniref:Uncharacterized protein n=1 Tax=Faunusvirus sp. TaxID=2487766 RepID=A0A3G4ZY59_9VIRU|nr:MAG: hypothetical protein Faunusvirus64_1 [Faunusvirus sp.]